MTYINLARTIRITYKAGSQEHDCEQYSNQTFVPGANIDREDVGWGFSSLSAVCCFMCVRVRSYFDRAKKLVADFVTKSITNMFGGELKNDAIRFVRLKRIIGGT